MCGRIGTNVWRSEKFFNATLKFAQALTDEPQFNLGNNRSLQVCYLAHVICIWCLGNVHGGRGWRRACFHFGRCCRRMCSESSRSPFRFPLGNPLKLPRQTSTLMMRKPRSSTLSERLLCFYDCIDSFELTGRSFRHALCAAFVDMWGATRVRCLSRLNFHCSLATPT